MCFNLGVRRTCKFATSSDTRFSEKITGTTQRTIWEQEGDERVFVRIRIGDVIDIIANNKIT